MKKSEVRNYVNVPVKLNTFETLSKMKGREGNITWDDVITYLIRREREYETKLRNKEYGSALEEYR